MAAKGVKSSKKPAQKVQTPFKTGQKAAQNIQDKWGDPEEHNKLARALNVTGMMAGAGTGLIGGILIGGTPAGYAGVLAGGIGGQIAGQKLFEKVPEKIKAKFEVDPEKEAQEQFNIYPKFVRRWLFEGEKVPQMKKISKAFEKIK